MVQIKITKVIDYETEDKEEALRWAKQDINNKTIRIEDFELDGGLKNE